MTVLLRRSSGVGFTGAGRKVVLSAVNNDATLTCDTQGEHECPQIHPGLTEGHRLSGDVLFAHADRPRSLSSDAKVQIFCIVSTGIIFSESKVRTEGLTTGCSPQICDHVGK